MGYGMAMAAEQLGQGRNMEDAIEENHNNCKQPTNLNIPEQAIFRSL